MAVLALAAGIFLGSSSDDSSDQATELPVATSAAPLPTVTEAPTTVTTESAGLEPLVIELDGILHRSANGREAIVEVIGGVTAECRYEPDDAADRISTVLDNRRSIRQELLDLDTVDSEGAQLVALYDAALVASIESNEHYVDWVWRSYSVARQDADDCFVPQGDDFVDAVEDSDRATAAKKEFVAAYNPVAERYGLRVWSDTDF
ncbi:MAG: hypothetical protein GY798_03860 [Hyphomicrobiales bacterium]|nr:hypothetical protein [Hyphomicrobiales bacterium]